MSRQTHTPEQAVIVHAARTGDNLVITAGAGTGKTSTLRMIAETLPGRGQYLAYNRAIADDAATTFPRQVKCMTAHAIAYRQIVAGTGRVERLRSARMPPTKQAQAIGVTGPTRLTGTVVAAPWQLIRLVNGTIRHFCDSADREVSHHHVPKTAGLDDPDTHRQIQAIVVPVALKAWADLSGETGKLPLTHDTYLKLRALTDPQAKVDYILFDEAQDANPAIAGIVRGQRATQQIAVGDSCQAIYGWRGAVDALQTWPAQHRLALSQSWRFGPAIASEANRWLTQLDADLRLTGNPGRDSRLGALPSADAVLCRTNATAMDEAITALKNGRRPAIVGGGDDLRKLAEASQQLRQRGSTTHSELYLFTSWMEVQDYVEQDDTGRDLKVAVKPIDEHGADTLIDYLSRLAPERDADVVLSTSHKAKGREWDRVRIADDFPKPKDDDGELTCPSPSECMLAYVAVTRAKTVLDRGSLAWIDDYQPNPAEREQRAS